MRSIYFVIGSIVMRHKNLRFNHKQKKQNHCIDRSNSNESIKIRRLITDKFRYRHQNAIIQFYGNQSHHGLVTMQSANVFLFFPHRAPRACVCVEKYLVKLDVYFFFCADRLKCSLFGFWHIGSLMLTMSLVKFIPIELKLLIKILFCCVVRWCEIDWN